jgi:hypothetical protein
VEAIPLLVDGLRIYRKSPRDANAVGAWDSGPAVQRLERSVRKIVVRPGAMTSDYETALAGATALADEQSAGADAGSLRGMALFRLSRFDEAALELTSAGQSSVENREYAVQRLASLAMTQHRLGRIEAARETMAEMRKLATAKSEDIGKAALGQETLALAGEAEGLLNSDRNEN